jgi:mannose-6-phosphate isomerase
VKRVESQRGSAGEAGNLYLGPLAFEEIFVAKPWGGRSLAQAAAKRLPSGERIGESWEVADHPRGTSVVQGGPLAGRTLRELMQAHDQSLLGRRAANGRFPLLVKLLDVSDAFSVQVHPDDECALAMKLGDCGKTEAWYVLGAGKGAWVVSGLKTARDIPRLRALAASGELGDRVRKSPARQGDVWLCKAGTIHAFGGGVTLFEVQQNSDATFRLYDWGRVGADGKPRELHPDEAVRAADGRALSLRRPEPRTLRGLPFDAQRLVACNRFVMDRWQIRSGCVRSKKKRFEILHVLAGSGRLRDPRWEEVALAKGRTVLVPACVREYEIVPRQGASKSSRGPGLEIVRTAEPE